MYVRTFTNSIQAVCDMVNKGEYKATILGVRAN